MTGTNKGEFRGKVVLVTGAGLGLGRALARAFASAGAWVCVNDLTPVNLDVTREVILSEGGAVKDLVYDVSNRMQCAAMIDEIVTAWGRLDILVNAARVIPRTTILEMDEWEWRRTMDVNLSAAFFLIQAAGQVMRQQGDGVIINFGVSENSLQSPADLGAFLASKMGIAGLTLAAMNEFDNCGVRLHTLCLHPAAFTAGFDWYPSENQVGCESPMLPMDEDSMLKDIIEQTLYLCSQDAANFTGKLVDLGRR